MSKWVEAVTLVVNEAKNIELLFKNNIFSYFGVLYTIINDGGSHFVIICQGYIDELCCIEIEGGYSLSPPKIR